MKVIIAGAGIGGLCAALCLKNSGFDAEICERSQLAQEAGAGIQLSPNAVKVLFALGLKQELAAVGFEPKAVRLRSFSSARLIAYRPLGPFSTDRYGAPYYHLHREALHRLLREAVAARNIPLHLGHTVIGYQESASGVDVEVETTDGQRHLQADLLVGADGIHSRLRNHFSDDAPRFTGMLAYRAVVDSSDLPAGLVEPTATVWMGPRRHLVHYYVDQGQRINLVAVVETDSAWREEAWQLPAEQTELLAAFDGWHRKVRRVLEAARDCHKWALYDRPPLPRWSSARSTLLGDAAHPMLPFLAQGAAMAIEDGWILSRLLEHREEDEPGPALDRYQRLRQLRTNKVAEASKAQGEMFHLDAPNQRLARDLKLGLGCRLLPEIAMAQYDWLHGYDPVRRFV